MLTGYTRVSMFERFVRCVQTFVCFIYTVCPSYGRDIRDTIPSLAFLRPRKYKHGKPLMSSHFLLSFMADNVVGRPSS